MEADIAKLAIAETPSSTLGSTSPAETTAPSGRPDSEQPQPQGTEGEEEELIDPSALPSVLDRLLFSYCELLDQYQAIQDRLSSSFTDGFINLAKANYESRTRFGKDYYHGGMTASKILTLNEKEFTPLYAPDTQVEYTQLSLVDVPLPSVEDTADVGDTEKVDASTTTTSTATEENPVRRRRPDEEKPDSTQEPEDDKKKPEAEQGESKLLAPKARKQKIPLNRDPIRWFGVLVPFSLRKSQNNFTEAVSDIANLLSIVNQLRALEAKVKHWSVEKG
ncbi:hypothetical protein V1520DRAFT_341362 [Lipomyces starkeyi]|uniref:Vacuolar ATPase assembly protein VMA22 n=1 Tax=Lipomyces starkeyi NRRL Y-11557 TaxID=675824 RepID=A0A1E3QG05_LIPST|nr:hypothetical protein LIPSTDRAFT_493 [Lipomyces starkeyi NRRL Y-11557]